MVFFCIVYFGHCGLTKRDFDFLDLEFLKIFILFFDLEFLKIFILFFDLDEKAAS